MLLTEILNLVFFTLRIKKFSSILETTRFIWDCYYWHENRMPDSDVNKTSLKYLSYQYGRCIMKVVNGGVDQWLVVDMNACFSECVLPSRGVRDIIVGWFVRYYVICHFCCTNVSCIWHINHVHTTKKVNINLCLCAISANTWLHFVAECHILVTVCLFERNYCVLIKLSIEKCLFLFA